MVATRWGVQRQVCLAYSQAWWWECHGLGCMSAAGHGELQFFEGTMNANMYCDILKQSMTPLPSEDWAAGQCSNITTNALLKKLRVKVDGLAKHISRPKPYWVSLGHPEGAFTPDANKSCYSHEVGRLNILNLLARARQLQSRCKCIPVFVKVRRIVYTAPGTHIQPQLLCPPLLFRIFCLRSYDVTARASSWLVNRGANIRQSSGFFLNRSIRAIRAASFAPPHSRE